MEALETPRLVDVTAGVGAGVTKPSLRLNADLFVVSGKISKFQRLDPDPGIVTWLAWAVSNVSPREKTVKTQG